ncbi:GNAT family N-acetyltransferase [Brevibacterium samyangense]|uniref:N-acetyltransferase domain-containing protein n=1 Tax=Brevibacterium samyangense TaxID=366888 RepID=A0ABP5F2D5_9MICO
MAVVDITPIDRTHLVISPLDEVDSLELRDFLVGEQQKFWGERDLSEDHDPFWFRQLAAGGLVARYKNEIVGYLLGVVPKEGPAFIHLVAARDDFRGQGIGRELYTAFLDRARSFGASEVQATTEPENAGAISFHSSLGFEGERIPDYAGAGRDRVLFSRALNGH